MRHPPQKSRCIISAVVHRRTHAERNDLGREEKIAERARFRRTKSEAAGWRPALGLRIRWMGPRIHRSRLWTHRCGGTAAATLVAAGTSAAEATILTAPSPTRSGFTKTLGRTALNLVGCKSVFPTSVALISPLGARVPESRVGEPCSLCSLTVVFVCSFETREQRYNDSLPKEAHENPTREAEQQRVADPRGLGRGFSSRDPEFRHVVGRPTQRW